MRIFGSFFAVWVFAVSGVSSLYNEISRFERETVDEALAAYALKPETNPHEKIIGNIYIYTEAPFTKEAGFLSLLDHLHKNTKDEIIRQYLFIEEGEAYNLSAVRDSEMSLRKQGLVRSLAVIVPVRSSTTLADHVDLLVASRDLLTLRPSLSFEGNADVLTDLMVGFGEHSIAGSNKSLMAFYEMKQPVHIFSSRYFDPHLFGSALELSVRPGFLFSRKDFSFDGFSGEFNLERPLISENDKWGYGLNFDYGSKPIIDFNGANVRTYDIPSTKLIENIERKYRWRYGKGRLQLRRSFGTLYKKEVFTSYGVAIKRPSLHEDLLLSDSEKEAFKRDVLPKDEFESFITLGFAYFHNQFLRLYDYNNFKLAESKRLGPNLTLSVDLSSKEVLFSDHSFLRPESKLSYTVAMGSDAFFLASLSTSNRYDGVFTDNTYKYGLSIVSPKFFDLFRLVVDGRLSTTADNRDNQFFSLGADTGIRGIKSGFYKDLKAFRTNVEIRSAPLDLWIFHLGFVLFYDIGSAFKQWNKINATQSVGFGIRVLLPQVSSQLFRLDIGFPIAGSGRDYHTVVPSFGTGQAFQ